MSAVSVQCRQRWLCAAVSSCRVTQPQAACRKVAILSPGRRKAFDSLQYSCRLLNSAHMLSGCTQILQKTWSYSDTYSTLDVQV